uniref:Uncharacterized protein n=1 Tax=Peronospora matthiolae TaxID=2874970 RepID=A0AAV1TUQ0_9STRA
MRPWVLVTAFGVSLSSPSWHAQVEAAPCDEICYTTELTGFGPGGAAGCACSGSRATRSGSGGCSCGQCYQETGGAIVGYAIGSDGTCAYGTNCGDCTRTPEASSAGTKVPPLDVETPSVTTSPAPSEPATMEPSSSPPASTLPPAPTAAAATTDAPTTASPVPTPGPPLNSAPGTLSDSGTSSTSGTSSNSASGTSSSSGNDSSPVEGNNAPPATATSGSSASSLDDAGKTAGSFDPSATSSDNSLETWQIALIICCGVLVFTVAVVSVLSCYCKARNRLNENEDDRADASYYQQQQHPRQRDDTVGLGGIATPSRFSQRPTSSHRHVRSGSSGSLVNETKLMYANSANSGSSDMLGTGLAPVHMRTSSGDQFGSVGGYLTDNQPNASNVSVGRQQDCSSARDRRLHALEL